MNLRKISYNKGSVDKDAPLIFGVVILLILLGTIYAQILSFLKSHPDFLKNLIRPFVEFFNFIAPYLKIFSFLFSILLIFGIIYFSRLYSKVLTEDKKKYTPEKKTGEIADVVNEKWHRVEEHINSQNPSDWKLAILEADIILDEMLEKMGYHGDSVGEKLKSIEKSDFTTLDYAWEAHKIRNSIAHEGSDFLINEREAKRVIELYKTVFKEFKFI